MSNRSCLVDIHSESELERLSEEELQKKSIQSVTERGYRLRLFTQVGYTKRVPVSLGIFSRIHNEVLGYQWLRKTVTAFRSKLVS